MVPLFLLQISNLKNYVTLCTPYLHINAMLVSACVSVCSAASVGMDSLQPYGPLFSRLLSPRDSPDKNTGVGNHPLLQGIFPNQGLNPGLPHCRQILYQLNHQGMLRWLLLCLYLQDPMSIVLHGKKKTNGNSINIALGR